MRKILLTAMVMLQCGIAALGIAGQDKAVPTDYRVGPEDVLEVNILQPEKLTTTVTVSPSGTISFPYIGEIQVEGLSFRQIQELIQRQLANDMKYPLITVMLRESRSRKFFIYGDVAKPGVYPMATETTVLKAITMAGGGTKNSVYTNVQILRKSSDPTGQEVIPANISEIIRGRATDPVIIPQDTIIVSEQKFFVAGDVARPGVYSMEDGMSVLKAITVAGGLVHNNAISLVKLLRTREEPAAAEEKKAPAWAMPEMIPFNVSKIIQGEQHDPAVFPKDTIIVTEQKYFVYGDVARPGMYPMEDGITVLRAITVAGGLVHNNAMSRVKVLRPRLAASNRGEQPTSKNEVEHDAIIVALHSIITGDTPDIVLNPLDTVVISGEQLFISGDVSKPGVYPLEDGMTVLRAITIAGGFLQSSALTQVKIIRPEKDGKSTQTVAFLLKNLMQGAPEGNMKLMPEDTITVTQGKCYVYGEVNRPGIYPMEEDTTVLKAIAMAGGFSKYGSASRVKILRPQTEGKGYETIKVNIKDIMEGAQESDIRLRPSDTVVIFEGIF